MKFYAVTKGSHSDYHIITITTDAEKAARLANKFSDRYDEARVEEYEESDIFVRDLWRVNFDRHGDVISVKQETNDYYYGDAYMCREDLYGSNFWIYVFADSEEAAIKIAAEKRAEYLAAKNGLI